MVDQRIDKVSKTNFELKIDITRLSTHSPKQPPSLTLQTIRTSIFASFQTLRQCQAADGVPALRVDFNGIVTVCFFRYQSTAHFQLLRSKSKPSVSWQLCQWRSSWSRAIQTWPLSLASPSTSTKQVLFRQTLVIVDFCCSWNDTATLTSGQGTASRRRSRRRREADQLDNLRASCPARWELK